MRLIFIYFTLIVILFGAGFNVRSQTVYEWYQDGIVVFQLKTSVKKMIPAGQDKQVDFRNIAFLEKEVADFGIYEVIQMHPNDRDENLRRTYQIKFMSIERVDDLIRRLGANTDLEYAEKKELHKHFLTPNDLGPNASNTAGTSPTNNQWALHRIQAQLAWDLSTGSANIRVAVTDDAIRTAHQDLQNKLLPGYDAPTGGTDPNPCGSNNGNHGTHVSGTVGAETNNGIGVASIGYNVSIIPVKIGNCNGALTHGYEGINWAANNGADVINMSWGGGGSSTYGNNVCNAAANAGVVLVAAAGNDGTNQQFYPAAYTSVIAVASTTPTDAKSSFSQYGTWISISAPGSNIRSSYATSNTAYSSISGTSMASPHVAGLVGLMKSYMPTASRTQLINCLLSSADDISAANPSYNGQLGSGRINAYQALLCMAQYNVALDAGITNIVQPSATVCASSFTPVITLRNFGSNTLTSVSINYSWGGNNASFNWTGSLTSGQTTNVTLPVQIATTGNYTFTASTTNPNGGADQNATNDQSTRNFSVDPNGQTVNLTLITDCYGDEINWQITDALSNVVASGGPYTVVAGGTTNNYSFCLPVGCYTFNITDTYGDGMHGAQWQNCSVNGNYFMTDQGGNTLFQMTAPNADYGTGTSHNFCVADPSNLNDAGIAQIISPQAIACSTSIAPQVELLNYGINTLNSVTITYSVGGAPQVFNWTGSLTSGQSASVTLPFINVANGPITITASTSNPNGQADDDATNDQSTSQILVYGGNGLPLPFTETFESNPFSNNTWTVVNPDNEVTWEVSTIVGTTPGNTAAKMDFFNYAQPGRRDGMISPKLNLSGYSSVNMTFEHAYRRYIVQGATQPAPTDSLLIYVSTDCGASWQKVFEAGENGTGTFATIASSNQPFTPTQTSDWCMGTVGANCFSVNLSAFIGQQVLIKFEGYNAGTLGNNLYVDNINITGVAVSQPPIADFTANSTSVCAGQTINFTDLSSNSPTSWSWSFPGGTPNTSTLQNPSVTYNTPGTYNVSLTATNSIGSDTEIKTDYVIVVTSPNAVATASTPVCAGANINLNAQTVSGATYSWSGPGSFSSSQQNPVRPNATLAMAGTYTLTVTTSGCSSTSTVNVVVNAAPNATASSNSPICDGGFIELNAGTVSGATYSWSGPDGYSATGQNAVVTGATSTNAGTYTVTVTQSGCSAQANVNVAVNTVPVPTISQLGGSLQATPSTGYTYQWFVDGVPIAGANSATYTPVANGNYTVTITDANSCSETSNGFLFTSSNVANQTWQDDVEVFPNPSNGQFTLKINASENEDAMLLVYNALGELVLSKRLNLAIGHNLHELNLQHQASGVYLLRISTSVQEQTIRVVKW